MNLLFFCMPVDDELDADRAVRSTLVMLRSPAQKSSLCEIDMKHHSRSPQLLAAEDERSEAILCRVAHALAAQVHPAQMVPVSECSAVSDCCTVAHG